MSVFVFSGKYFFCMKFFHKLTFIFLFSGLAFAGENPFSFKRLDFSSSFNFQQDAKQKNYISGNGGIKAVFSNAEACGYINIPRSSFGQFFNFSAFTGEGGEYKFKYGISCSIPAEKAVFQLKAGMLSFSRVISRLKNPVPSSLSSATVKSFSWSSGLGVSLPSVSSSVQPLSLYAGSSFSLANIPCRFYSFVTQDGNCFVSGASKIKFSSRSFMEFSLNSGSFFLEGKTSSLQKCGMDFEKKRYFAGSVEFSFQMPCFKTLVMAGIHESPWEIKSIWINSACRIVFPFFLVDVKYFAIPTSCVSPYQIPLIGISSSQIKIVEQGEINPQIMFSLGKFNVRLGAGLTQTWKVLGEKEGETVSLLKINSGFLGESDYFSFKGNLCVNNIIAAGYVPSSVSVPEKYYEISSGFYGKIKKHSWSFTSSHRQYPPLSETSFVKQKISLNGNFSFRGKFPFTLGSGSDFILKNGLMENFSADMTFSFVIQKKHFKLNVKTGFKISR